MFAGVPFLENNGSKTTANRNEIQTQTKDKQDKLDWEEIVNNIGDFYKHKYQSYTSRLHTEDTGVSFDDDSAARIKHNPIYTTNGSTTASATSMRLCRKVPQSSNEGSMTYKRYVVGVHDHIPGMFKFTITDSCARFLFVFSFVFQFFSSSISSYLALNCFSLGNESKIVPTSTNIKKSNENALITGKTFQKYILICHNMSEATHNITIRSH